MTNNPQTLCRTCVTPIGYVDCPTGGWWAHETHPADEHDAVPGAWVDGDELMEAIAAEVWEHCASEGTSLVVDDPRNIAGTAAAVARRMFSLPAVPVPPATPATAPGQAALRDRIAEALVESRRPGLGGMTEAEAVAHMAAAVLSVLPPTADRRAEIERLREQLEEAEDTAEQLVRNVQTVARERESYRKAWKEEQQRRVKAEHELRRMADEAQPPSPRCVCGETACESELCDCDSPPCPVDHADEAQQPEPPERNFAAYQAAIARVALVLREARKHREQTDPSERQDCVMCGADHFAEIRDAIKGKQPDTETHDACTCGVAGACFAPAGHYADCPQAVVSQPGKEAETSRTVCVCGHTRGEHATVSGRLLCDECDGLSPEACKEFEAL